MGEFRKLTVELDATTTDLIERVVAEGQFADAAEAMRFAVRLLADWKAEQSPEEGVGRDELERLWLEGEASGEPVDATVDFFENIKRRGRERLASSRATR